jgi:hypothetical protein
MSPRRRYVTPSDALAASPVAQILATSKKKQKSTTTMHRSKTGAVLSDDATTNPRPGAIWYHDGWRFELQSARSDLRAQQENNDTPNVLHLFQTRGGRWYFLYGSVRYATRLGDPRAGWFELTHARITDPASYALREDAAQILALVLW